jgi:hypothetical protein
MKNLVVIMYDKLGWMFEETGLAYFKVHFQLPFGGPCENKQNLSVVGYSPG